MSRLLEESDFTSQTSILNLITSEMINESAYQGFDPAVTKRRLIQMRWQKADIARVISFYVMRGTSIRPDSVNRSTATVQTAVARWQTLGLVQAATTREDITINRIVSCMADQVAYAIAKHSTECRVVAAEVSPDLPVYLKFSAGASLCTSDEQLEHWIMWSTCFSAIISRNTTTEETVRRYARIQYESRLFDQQRRAAIQARCQQMLSGN